MNTTTKIFNFCRFRNREVKFRRNLWRFPISKKAAIEIPVNLIVIIIIAILMLVLILFFVRNMIGKETVMIEEKLAGYALPPNPIIELSPSLPNYLVFQSITFDGSKSYDMNYKIVGYYWDIDNDLIIDSRSSEYIREIGYFEPGEYNVTLKVVNDQGAIGTESRIVRVVTNNQKEENIRDSLFLVRDNDRQNNETILRLIPVTTWYDADGLHRLPFYVYYVEEKTLSLTPEKLQEIMDKYGKKHAYVFDDPYIPTNLPGYTIDKVDNIDEMYFDELWKLYEYVVLVNPDHESNHLIASLFSAFYNSPIIFVDRDNIDFYRDYIRKDSVEAIYCIPSCDALDEDVQEIISGLKYKEYSPDQLRKGNVNRIIKLTSNVTMQT